MICLMSTQESTAALQASMPAPTCVGVFGIGLDTYWGQFNGLKPRLEGYLATIEAAIAETPA